MEQRGDEKREERAADDEDDEYEDEDEEEEGWRFVRLRSRAEVGVGWGVYEMWIEAVS